LRENARIPVIPAKAGIHFRFEEDQAGFRLSPE
jgi:hypothetical protein